MNKSVTLLYIVIIIFFFTISIVAGMLIGTYAVIDHVAKGLAGSTFIVNFNETRLVEEMNKTIMPSIKGILNKTGEENA